MGFWVTVAVYAALYVISKYTAPKAPKTRLDRNADGHGATVDDGTTVPIYYGTVKFDRPNLVWSSPRRLFKLSGVDAQCWGANMMYVLGIPGGKLSASTDYDHTISYETFEVNGQELRAFSTQSTLSTWLSDGSTSAPFSGNVFKANINYSVQGVRGALIFNDGFHDNPPFGAGQFGAAPGNDPTLWPAYRFQTTMFCCGDSHNLAPEDVDVDDQATLNEHYFIYGFSPELPQIVVTVRNPCPVDMGGGFPEIGHISGNANPVAVIYDLLTNDWARIGLPESKIDKASFSAAAIALDEEYHGWAGILYDPKDAADVIREILSQINAVLYEDPVNRVLVLKLVRQDYTVGLLPVFDPDNVSEIVQLNMNTFAETYNVVRVQYISRYDDFSPRTATERNPANIAAQGGRVRAITFNYPGIRDAATAQHVAARELAELSAPIVAVKFKANRDAFTLRPGGVFAFTWPELGIDLVPFRVQHIDFGQLGGEEIVVDAIQDTYDFSVTNGDDGLVPFPPEFVLPLEERYVTEAPRYFIDQAVAHSLLPNTNTGRVLYVAAPMPQQPSITGYTATEFDDDFVRVVDDLGARPQEVPSYATVETLYPRDEEPYDTFVGLRINDLTFGATKLMQSATEAAIRGSGKNFIYVGGTEFMAFESATDLGGGTWRLNNVWRGLLDTPTVEHAVGERVFFLTDARAFDGFRLVGRLGVADAGQDVNTEIIPWKIVPRGEDEIGFEYDRFVARGRTLLPYPPVDMFVNSVKDGSLESEGVVVNWAKRNYLTQTIVRGDEADETVSPTLQYVLKSQKIGPRMRTFGPLYTIFQTTSSGALGALTRSGHGEIEVSVEALETADGKTSWDRPRVLMDCKHWRNLLTNSEFSGPMNLGNYQEWITTQGVARTTTGQITTAFQLFRGDPADDEPIAEASQIVRVDGYDPERMTAVLDFFWRTFATDLDDELTVTIEALDEDDAVLGSSSFGPQVASSTVTWTRQVCTYANLPAGTVTLKVRVIFESSDEPSTCEMGFTAPKLRLGQMTAQAVTNGLFSSSLTGWTTATGTWTQVTTNPVDNDGYAVASGSASPNELFQDVTIPAGYEYSDVLVTWMQGNDTADTLDVGWIELQARTGGGTVLASAAAAQEGYSSTTNWVYRELVLESVPPDATVIRVRLLADHLAAGTASSKFDDIFVRFHKRLDPDGRVDFDFRTPVVQRLPRGPGEWYEAFPTVPMPDYGMYDGNSPHGYLTIEPTLSSTNGFLQGKFVGPYDPETGIAPWPCWDLHSTDAGIVGSDDRRFYGNFKITEPFTCVIVFRRRISTAATCGLVGRRGGTSDTGWWLELTSAGFVRATMSGVDGVASATRGTLVGDGAPWFAAISYDPLTSTLTVADPSGTSSTSTVGIGQIQNEDLVPFSIGKVVAGQDCLDGQVARVWIWRQALSGAQLSSLWTHGTVPAGLTMASSTRTGSAVVKVGSDNDGDLFASWHQSQFAFANLADQGFGAANPLVFTNLAPACDLRNTTNWIRDAGPTYVPDQPGPLGFRDALQWAATATSGLGVRHSDVALSATTNVQVVWFARTAGSPHDATVILQNSSGVLKGTHDYTVGATWQRFEHTFTTWDASTANGRVKFFASNDATSRTIQLAGPIVVRQGTGLPVPLATPYSGSLADSTVTFTQTLSRQFNHEGEVYLDAYSVEASPTVSRTIVNIDNGTNTNDSRLIKNSTTAQPQFQHFDGLGGSNTASASAATWTTVNTYRGRWNRAALLDAAATFSAIAVNTAGAVVTSGRAVVWTPSSTVLTRHQMPPSNMVVRRFVLFTREIINLEQ